MTACYNHAHNLSRPIVLAMALTGAVLVISEIKQKTPATISYRSEPVTLRPQNIEKTQPRLVPLSCWGIPPPLEVGYLLPDNWMVRVAKIVAHNEPLSCGIRIRAKLARSTAYLIKAFGKEFAPQIAALDIYQRCYLCWLMFSAIHPPQILAINQLDELAELRNHLPLATLAGNALQRVDLNVFFYAANFELTTAMRLLGLAEKHHNRLLQDRNSPWAMLSASLANGRGIEDWMSDCVVPLANKNFCGATSLLQDYWKAKDDKEDFQKLYIFAKAGWSKAKKVMIESMFPKKEGALSRFPEGLAFMQHLAASENLDDVIFAISWPDRNYQKVQLHLRHLALDICLGIKENALQFWARAMSKVDTRNLQQMVAAYVDQASLNEQIPETTVRGAIFALQELSRYGNEAAQEYLVSLAANPLPRLRSMAQAALINPVTRTAEGMIPDS